MKPDKTMIDNITKALVDDGKIIEAGWVGLKMLSIPKDAPPIQIEEMRNSFFAGAQHLFSSIMTMLDSDAEPTENDLRRMDLINKELEQFLKEYKENHFI